LSCERLYRDTRTRLATENIGLARVADGTDLVRIGQPQRPEFAAWRYGDQLLHRRRRLYDVPWSPWVLVWVQWQLAARRLASRGDAGRGGRDRIDRSSRWNLTPIDERCEAIECERL
jgi:hypothetical protein